MIKYFLLAISIVLLFSSCKGKEKIKVSGNSVKVGILVPLTGSTKRYAQQSLAGINAAFEMNPYLKNGDKIEFIIADTQSSVQGAKRALHDLQAENPAAIISFLGSNEMLEIKEELKENKIPLVVTLATNDNIPSMANNIAQVCFDNNMQSLVAAHYIKDEKLIRHVGVVYNSTNYYSYALAEEFNIYYKSIGGIVDFYISIDNIHEVKKLVDKKKTTTQFLYNTTSAATTLKILKTIRQRSWNLEVLSGDGLLSSVIDLKKTDISKLDGLYITEHYAHNVLKSKKRKRLEYLLHQDGYKESSYALLAYDGYQLLQNALNQCENVQQKCVKKHLLNSKVINGSSGNFSMIDAKSRREVYVDKISSGKLYKEIVTY